MKTVLIIGMGRFGHHLTNNMISLGNEVMIVDKDESRLEDLTKLISNIKIGDCTNEDVLRSFGVANFDICFVCIDHISKISNTAPQTLNRLIYYRQGLSMYHTV